MAEPTAGPSASTLLVGVFPTNLDDQARPAAIHATEDLLSRFELSEVYDRFVRPYQPPEGGGIRGETRLSGKKGKARMPAGNEAAGIRVEPDQRKLEKGYAHMVQDVPARKLGVKSDRFHRLIMNPDHQPVTIRPFSDDTIRKAFSLQPGPLEGTELDSKSKKKRAREEDVKPSISLDPSAQHSSPPRKKRRK